MCWASVRGQRLAAQVRRREGVADKLRRPEADAPDADDARRRHADRDQRVPPPARVAEEAPQVAHLAGEVLAGQRARGFPFVRFAQGRNDEDGQQCRQRADEEQQPPARRRHAEPREGVGFLRQEEPARQHRAGHVAEHGQRGEQARGKRSGRGRAWFRR